MHELIEANTKTHSITAVYDISGSGQKQPVGIDGFTLEQIVNTMMLEHFKAPDGHDDPHIWKITGDETEMTIMIRGWSGKYTPAAIWITAKPR